MSSSDEVVSVVWRRRSSGQVLSKEVVEPAAVTQHKSVVIEPVGSVDRINPLVDAHVGSLQAVRIARF